MTSATIELNHAPRVNDVRSAAITIAARPTKELLGEPITLFGVTDRFNGEWLVSGPSVTAQSILRAQRSRMESAPSSIPSVASRDFFVTIQKLRSLMEEDDEADRPSRGAYERADRLLRAVASAISYPFPRAIVATGAGNGVRLLWTRGEKDLRVIIGGSSSNKSYIYWRDVNRSGVDNVLNDRTVSEYLTWIVGDE